jgi:hypothetical protein
MGTFNSNAVPKACKKDSEGFGFGSTGNATEQASASVSHVTFFVGGCSDKLTQFAKELWIGQVLKNGGFRRADRSIGVRNQLVPSFPVSLRRHLAANLIFSEHAIFFVISSWAEHEYAISDAGAEVGGALAQNGNASQ